MTLDEHPTHFIVRLFVVIEPTHDVKKITVVKKY